MLYGIWLELFPKKIMYGSDTFPISDGLGAEEPYWVATESARSALTAALAEMVSEKGPRAGPGLEGREGGHCGG